MEHVFPDIEKNLLRDWDGDGLSDYEEMILMSNPLQWTPPPRKPTGEDLLAGESNPQRRQQPKQLTFAEAEERRVGLATFVGARRNRDSFRPSAEKLRAKISTLAEDLHDSADQEPGARRRIMAVDSYAASLVGADVLWPTASDPLIGANGADPLPSSGKPLLPPIGVWDRGGVQPSDNPGFGNRLQFGDLATEQEFLAEGSPRNSSHAVLMSSIIALKRQGAGPQGIAWAAKIRNFTFENDYQEMVAEVARSGMRFSNHSYSPKSGWEPASGGFNWWGPPALVGDDPEFGAYSLESKTIDNIIYTAGTYLPVYSAGNDAFDHGPVPTNGVIDPNDSSYHYANALDGNGNVVAFPIDANPVVEHPSDGGLPQAGALLPEDVDSRLEAFNGTVKVGLGLNTISSLGSAKNNLTVGAVISDKSVVTGWEDLWLSLLSSRGPTDDGRLKPDLVAPGEFETPEIGGLNYGSTSAAAATVTGILALLDEININGCGGFLLASTWKALLLNTAIDGRTLDPFVGTESTQTYTREDSYLGTAAHQADLVGPDFFHGYGMADAEASAALLRKNLASRSGRAHLRQHVFYDPSNTPATGDNVVIEIPVEHDGTSTEMRIMLCWTDPPYQAAQVEAINVGVFDPDQIHTTDFSPRLINDLDLRVIAPNLVELKPLVLDRNFPLVAAAPGDNTLDNVEQIIISTPVPGTYLIRVSHKGILKSWEKVVSNPPDDPAKYELIPGQHQAFSLAISGNLDPEPHNLVLEIGEPDFQAGGDIVPFSFESFIGLRFQLEGSDDLLTWTDEGDPFDVEFRPQPLTRFYPNQHQAKRFYRIREVGPLEDL